MDTTVTELDLLCDRLARLWVEADKIRTDARRAMLEAEAAEIEVGWLDAVPSQGDWNRVVA